MKCGDVRTLLSQIYGRSVSIRLPQSDVDFLASNDYLNAMRKEDYDRSLAEVSNLSRMTEDLQREISEERNAEAALDRDEGKVQSFMFHLQGAEKKQADLQRVEADRATVSRERADVVQTDSKIKELIQKKSMIDRMVPYDGQYLSLTGLGVVTLGDLNIRNYRVSDNELSDFIEETRATSAELRSIAEKGSFHENFFRASFPDVDRSQLWSVSIGLAKLQADQNQISETFRLALGALQRFNSTIDNKMMAAEIMTSMRKYTSHFLSSDNTDIKELSASLVRLEDEVRHRGKVPKDLSAGVATVILSAKRYDGTYPVERFVQFSKLTDSCESAAILSVLNVPSDPLAAKFLSFRSMFNSWGYIMSEDTELSSAYLAVSDLGPDDVKTKLTIIVDALKNYLEYPLVAATILASIPTLEANETLDLMEKASSLLGSFATGLERSVLVSLAVRMIHGIKNELVQDLDPTAKIAHTPVQFTYAPSYTWFVYHRPLIITHSSYFPRFSGYGGAHPGHGHGVGGFAG